MLTPINSSSSLTHDQQQRIDSLLHNSKAANTITAYQSDWTHYTQFCSSHSHDPLPSSVDTILLYMSELSLTHKHSTIKRRLASINKAHTSANHPSPTSTLIVKEMLDSIARTYGHKQTPKKALLLDDIKTLIDCIDITTISGKRDKTLLLVGFTTASRRSELVSINVEDLTFTNEGMDINILETKTHQYITKSILNANNDYCPIVAVKEWLTVSHIKYDSLFRSIKKGNNVHERLTDESVANIIKKYAKLAGLDPKLYAGHSLRSGMLTSGSQEGFNDAALMKQSGHKSRSMVDRYTQAGNRYKNNVTSILSTL